MLQSVTLIIGKMPKIVQQGPMPGPGFQGGFQGAPGGMYPQPPQQQQQHWGYGGQQGPPYYPPHMGPPGQESILSQWVHFVLTHFMIQCTECIAQ